MSDQIVITAPKSLVQRFLGKVILLVILGCVVGYFFAQDQRKEFEQWKKRTPAEQKVHLEQRNRDYETNLKNPLPTWADMVVMVVAFCLVSGLYELLGYILSRPFKRICLSSNSSTP